MLGKGHGGLCKPQQRKKEESERLRGERDQIKFIDLRFERWQVARFRKLYSSLLFEALMKSSCLLPSECLICSRTWGRSK